MPEETFQELMARVRSGDEAAAAKLVRQYEPVLQRIIRVRLADPRLRRTVGASDIFQSVMGSFFVRAGLGQYELKTPEDLVRLLTVMVRNRVVDKVRKKDVERSGPEPAPLEAAAELPSPDPTVTTRIAVHEMAREARARLAPDVLEVLAWREDGVSWNEIAQRRGMNPEAVRKRYERAVAAVAEALEGKS